MMQLSYSIDVIHFVITTDVNKIAIGASGIVTFL